MAVFSTVIALVFIVGTGAGVFTVIDSFVNMCALVIMTRYWKGSFYRLCALLLHCVSSFDCCFDDVMRNNITSVVNHYSANGDAADGDCNGADSDEDENARQLALAAVPSKSGSGSKASSTNFSI